MSPMQIPADRRRFLTLAGLGVSAAALGGCGTLFKVATTTPSLYTLVAAKGFPAGPQVPWQLVVDEPVASRAIDTDYIALRPSTTELKYFDSARWAERAPRMVQTLLVESFENSGRIVAVGRQAVGLRADFNFVSELRDFQAEYPKGLGAPPVIRVRLSVKMIVQPQQIIVAARGFESTRQLTKNDMPSIIAGFDDALGETLRQSVEWALAQSNPNTGKLL